MLLQGNFAAAATEAALHAARARGARTMLNPAPLWWDMRAVLELCDIVVANRGEAATLTGENTPEDAAGKLRARAGQAAIVTLGADGCILAANGAIRQFPALPVRAIDSTGCGDAFCGALAAALARGVALDVAIAAAQRAAAVTATRPGAFAALPTHAELAE